MFTDAGITKLLRDGVIIIIAVGVVIGLIIAGIVAWV